MKKYHHTGYPTSDKSENEVYLPQTKVTVVENAEDNPYQIEKLRFDNDSWVSDLIKKIPHIAFVVDNIEEEIKDKKILIEPMLILGKIKMAFIEEDGVPIEFMQFIEN